MDVKTACIKRPNEDVFLFPYTRNQTHFAGQLVFDRPSSYRCTSYFHKLRRIRRCYQIEQLMAIEISNLV